NAHLMPVRVDQVGVDAVVPGERGDPREVGERVVRYPAAVTRADVPHDATERRVRGPVEGVSTAGGDDRVEHERLDVLRIAAGVRERAIRAVRDPEEGDLVHAQRLPYRLDVVRGIAARGEGSRGPQVPGTRLHVGIAAPRQPRAVEPVGGAGTALVEDDQVTGGEPRGERACEEGEEGQRRLAGPAGEGHDRS